MNSKRIIKFTQKLNIPEACVEFSSNDKTLEGLFYKAESMAFNNIRAFPADFNVLVESKGYSRLYTETQPMGGEMYAKRNLRIALNNQLLFMMCQRADGRLPGGVFPPPENIDWRHDPLFRWVSQDWLDIGYLACFGQLQGNALPYPAFKMYYRIGKSDEYLRLLAECLESFDAYLWKTRDPYGEGVLQSWCVWDTGEDNCTRFKGSPNCWPHDYPPDGKNTPNPANEGDRERYYLRSHLPDDIEIDAVTLPFRSMDMMAYSYENRAVRAMISEELNDGKTGFWWNQAEIVRSSFKKHLWRPEHGAAFDKDRHNNFMDVLTHNNLRCMWYGLFDQDMADEFVNRHLLNEDEFFTPIPLPSIAANDKLFCNITNNNWSGPPQGLTWQRLIRALENYGYYSELTLFGRKFIELIKQTELFVQQFDPFDVSNPISELEKSRDGYGPSLLAFLEYVSRMSGIHFERGIIYWSGLNDFGQTTYTQCFGHNNYTLGNNGEYFVATINGVEIFSCSVGVRVCTDINGNPLEVVGIDVVGHMVEFSSKSFSYEGNIAPNQIVALSK